LGYIRPVGCLTYDWLWFTANKVDRGSKNQFKARMLPLWNQVRKAFKRWAGEPPGLGDERESLFDDPEDMRSPVRAAHDTRIILYNELHREWFALPQEFREDCKKFAAPYELGAGARPV